MNDFFYKKLDAYQLAKGLTIYVYALLRKYPSYEQHAICSQIRRSVVSVPSNIAEGMGRFAIKERIHFLEIAYGSLTEVMCQLDISHSLGYISDDEFNNAESMIEKTAKVMSGLRKSLQNKITIQ